MKEYWIEFEDKYMISNTGIIRNKHGKDLSTKSGLVILNKKMYRVKNLIARLFLETQPGEHISLIDKSAGYGVENIKH